MNKFGYGGVYVVEEEPPTVQGSLNGRFFNGKVGGHCDLGTGDASVSYTHLTLPTNHRV